MDPHDDPAVIEELAGAGSSPITVDITTTGRRSGEPRRIEIWVVKVGDRLVIGGTPGRRDWFANVAADPRMTLHLKGAVVADLAYRATAVVDADVRREIWTHPITKWYRGQSNVEELLAGAPTVELSPR